MEIVLELTIAVYALVTILGLALLIATYHVRVPRPPEGFSRAGWIDVATEVSLEVPADRVVQAVSSATAEWAEVRTEFLDERIRPGEGEARIIDEADAKVILRSEESQGRRSRFEVLPRGNQRCLVRWFAQYRSPRNVGRIVIDLFYRRSKLEKAMASSLRVLQEPAVTNERDHSG